MLAKGMDPQSVLDTLLREDPDREVRQVGIVDAGGGLRHSLEGIA